MFLFVWRTPVQEPPLSKYLNLLWSVFSTVPIIPAINTVWFLLWGWKKEKKKYNKDFCESNKSEPITESRLMNKARRFNQSVLCFSAYLQLQMWSREFSWIHIQSRPELRRPFSESGSLPSLLGYEVTAINTGEPSKAHRCCAGNANSQPQPVLWASMRSGCTQTADTDRPFCCLFVLFFCFLARIPTPTCGFMWRRRGGLADFVLRRSYLRCWCAWYSRPLQPEFPAAVCGNPGYPPPFDSVAAAGCGGSGSCISRCGP